MGKQELLKTRIRGDREYEKKQNGGSHDCGSRDDGYDRLQKPDSSNRDNERNGNRSGCQRDRNNRTGGRCGRV